MSLKRKLPDITMSSWVQYGPECDFPIQNLPYGVFKPNANASARCGVAIGDMVVDLWAMNELGYFADCTNLRASVFEAPALNGFMQQSKASWDECRAILGAFLDAKNADKVSDEVKAQVMHKQSDVIMQMPANIGDYTDFYASRNHATNVGVMFRGIDNALQPNWTSLPVGYHGRASSVVLSGTPITRPRGQICPKDKWPKGPAEHGVCKIFDFELEVGCFLGGKENELGDVITMAQASDRLFGLVMLNDWSARDIQKWEYVPLGPFTGKSLGTTISPWVVPMAALEQFRVEIPQDPVPLKYLQETKESKNAVSTFDLSINVTLQTEKQTEPHVICASNLKYLYWSFQQMLVQHSSTGANMRAGDLMGSGTISGTTREEYGSMLELSWAGRDTTTLPSGETRKFLADGDTVNLSGFGQGDGFRVGFGDCKGMVMPAKPDPY